MTFPRISLEETFYAKVSASTELESDGVVIPDGETHAIYRFRANGADPNAYVRLVWDNGGDQEKIIASTKGDIDILFDTTGCTHCYTGNGTKKMSIVIENNNDTQSPYIGGEFEMVRTM